MRFLLTSKARRDYERLAKELQKTADRQFLLLLRDIRHPSLHAKKYDERRDIWQARLTRGWRFYFQIREDVYHIVAVVRHPK